MVSFPPCKINLGLQIINKRADGYHNLSTCFYPVPWTDILEIIPSDQFAFTYSGSSIAGREQDNLCVKAYNLLKQDFDLAHIKMHLHKIIPMGAGLGGGSSDAAHVLRSLNIIFQLRLTSETLYGYASQLGSDCAFFVQDKPMIGSSRGERLSQISLDLSGKFLVIVKPDVHVSTVEAYAGIEPQEPENDLHKILVETSLAGWKEVLKNDFEQSVFQKYPEINQIKDKLYSLGAIYASMSGSGSAVFGIFEHEIDQKNAFKKTSTWSGFL